MKRAAKQCFSHLSDAAHIPLTLTAVDAIREMLVVEPLLHLCIRMQSHRVALSKILVGDRIESDLALGNVLVEPLLAAQQ